MFSDKERELNDQCKIHQGEIKILNKRLDDKNKEINSLKGRVLEVNTDINRL